MKCKYGKRAEWGNNVWGVVDLDNLDIVDLNFKNATPDTIYFYNLAKKLTERGEAKMRGLGLYCNEYNTDSFIYILPEKPLTIQQKAYRNKKNFIDIFNRAVNRAVIKENTKESNKVITEELLLDNGWEDKYDCIDELYYEKYIENSCNLILRKNYSNMINRDWSLHIDNDSFETIANIDIQTIDHFNKVMELMEISYSL